LSVLAELLLEVGEADRKNRADSRTGAENEIDDDRLARVQQGF
jgi:hypothetical protein